MIQIKCFEENHEADLEEMVNDFLFDLADTDVIDVKYCASHFCDHEQIYSFSACVLYRINQ